MPGLVKIGLTGRDPQTRVAELTRATGVPAPFVVAWCRAVSNCASVEAVVHRMLHDRRVTDRREFFRCDVATARQVIEAAAGAALDRAYHPIHGRKRSKGRRRRLRRGDVAALLFLGAVAVVLVLLLLKPALPGWLPHPVAVIGRAIEGQGFYVEQ